MVHNRTRLSEGYAHDFEPDRERAAGAASSPLNEHPIDPGDPFLSERIFGEFHATALDKSDDPVAQLDWVGGFADKGCTELETFLTPMLKCIGQTPHTYARCCTAIARIEGASSAAKVPLGSVGYAGGIYSTSKPRTKFNVPNHARVYDHRSPARLTSYLLDMRDEASACLPFADIQRVRPEVAKFIASRCACPPSVSFFILDSPGLTAIIPTASILLACYAPASLVAHLSTERSRGTFASPNISFDGYRYTDTDFCYPMRSIRYFARAEHEVAQILPRAAAYHQRHGTFAPLLVRPPFLGRVTITGQTISESGQAGTMALFTDRIQFIAPTTATLSTKRMERADYLEWRNPVLEYAPHLSREIRLVNAGRSVDFARTPFKWFEDHDVHEFRLVSFKVQEAVRRGEIRGDPDVAYNMDKIIRIRNWCANRR